MEERGEPSLRPPTRERVVDDVHRSLEEAILTGEMPPGYRLVETQLAERLRVSRTTVREALLKLEHAGLVVNTPRGATLVTDISEESAFDLRVVRAMLEGYAVQSRIASLYGEVGAELERIIEEMSEVPLPKGLPQLIDLDFAFHRILIGRAQSALLMELWGGLNAMMRAVFLRVIEEGPIAAANVAAVHRDVLAELRSGDADRAQRAIVYHYTRRYELPGQGDAVGRVLVRLPLTRRE